MQELERNKNAIAARVQQACLTVGRSAADIRVVAVTKSVEPEVAAALARTGLVELGESRVPELERKHAFFQEARLDVAWHFLGHLQRNKARRVVAVATEIHSLDSFRLLETLARLADELDARPRLYFEVQLSGETEKFGFAPGELEQAVELARNAGLPLAGLMTMAPRIRDGATEPARVVFERLAELAAALPGTAFVGGRPLLSMGMSEDFEVAIEAGADVIRVGRAFFAGTAPAPAATREDA